MCYGISFLLAALALELLTGWAGHEKAPDELEGYFKIQYYAVIDLGHLLVPAVWGAILAVVMVEIIFSTESQSMAAGDANLGPMVLAFAVGLSIKPIYSAFETMVEGVAQRFKTKK